MEPWQPKQHPRSTSHRWTQPRTRLPPSSQQSRHSALPTWDMQAAPRFLCIPPSSQKRPSSQNQPKPGQLPMLDPPSSLLQETGLSLTPSLNQWGPDSQKKLWGEFPALSGPLKRTLPANNWAIHQSFLGIKKERASFYHSLAEQGQSSSRRTAFPQGNQEVRDCEEGELHGRLQLGLHRKPL